LLLSKAALTFIRRKQAKVIAAQFDVIVGKMTNSKLRGRFQERQAVARRENAYAPVFGYVQKVTVASDEERAFCFDGSRQDMVIAGVSRDDIQEDMPGSDFGEVAKNGEVILDVRLS